MRFSIFVLSLLACIPAAAQTRWTEKAANDWYAQQPWLVGGNYIPASAINELEMWQADTFDAKTDRPRIGLGAGHSA